MQKLISHSGLIITMLLLIHCTTSDRAAEKPEQDATEFATLNKKADWNLIFEDDCTGDWSANWVLDGLIATVENSDEGMHFKAGPEPKNDAHHAVLWTKPSFSGNIKIEYDYTKTDSGNSFVNILYIQATGVGEAPYVKDIFEWKAIREVPTMRKYFDNMNALHISYSVLSNTVDSTGYIRARRYPAAPNNFRDSTKIIPSYDTEPCFITGKPYHITTIKTNDTLYFKVEGEGDSRLYTWDLSDIEPVTEGRVGLRHMYTRWAMYKNFKIYTEED
jgi:hypothetical protein